MIWASKEMSAPFSPYFPESVGFSRIKYDAMTTLRNVTNCMLSKLGRKNLSQDKIEQGRLLQIYHMTHLYAMDGLMDHLFHLVSFKKSYTLSSSGFLPT